jgi:hypothetical protein
VHINSSGRCNSNWPEYFSRIMPYWGTWNVSYSFIGHCVANSEIPGYPPLPTFSTDDPSIDPALYIISFERHF